MRDARAIATVVAFIVGLLVLLELVVLAVVSAPWLVMAAGHAALGNDTRSDWWADHAPFVLVLDSHWSQT